MKSISRIFLLSLVILVINKISAAMKIDSEFEKQNLLQVQMGATKYKQLAICSQQLGTEEILLGKCIYASKSTDPIAAFTQFFDHQKEKAKESFASFIVTICPGDDDSAPFLHASIPAGTTKAAFITFTHTLIDSLNLPFAIDPTKSSALDAGLLLEEDLGKRESRKGTVCDSVTLPTTDKDPHGEQFKIDSWNHISSFVYGVLQRRLKRMSIEAGLADETIFAEGSGIRDEVVKLRVINPKDSELHHFLSAMQRAVFG